MQGSLHCNVNPCVLGVDTQSMQTEPYMLMDQGYTNPGCQVTEAIAFVWWCLKFVCPQYGTHLMLPSCV